MIGLVHCRCHELPFPTNGCSICNPALIGPQIPQKGEPLNNADTPTTPTLAVTTGQRVRILEDAEKDHTYTITEINSVGKTGKQFRCAMICDQTGETKTGIAPSRLAPLYAAKGPKEYRVGGFVFRPEVLEAEDGLGKEYHPAMFLAGYLKALAGAELLDLVKEACEKGTNKAHTEVVLFCAGILPLMRTPQPPKTFFDKLKFGFNQPEPNYAPVLIRATLRLHAAQVTKGGAND